MKMRIWLMIIIFMYTVNAVALHCPNDYHQSNLTLYPGDSFEHGIRVWNYNGVKIKLNITISDSYNSTVLLDKQEEYILEPDEHVSLNFNVSVPKTIFFEKEHKVSFTIIAIPLEERNNTAMITNIGNCATQLHYRVESKQYHILKKILELFKIEGFE